LLKYKIQLDKNVKKPVISKNFSLIFLNFILAIIYKKQKLSINCQIKIAIFKKDKNSKCLKLNRSGNHSLLPLARAKIYHHEKFDF